MKVLAMSGSAPLAVSALIASTRLNDAAKMSGVWPHSASLAFLSAPASISRVTIAALPALAARCKGVAPLGRALASTTAPAFSRTAATASLPARAATCRGVYCPMRVTAAALAPAYTSMSASSALLRSAAQCKADMPSPRAALTSAPSLSSARMAATSPRIAASATGEVEGAAPTMADRHNAPMRLRANRRTILATPAEARCGSSTFKIQGSRRLPP